MFGLDKSMINFVEKNHSRFSKITKNSLKVKGEEVLIISDHGSGENALSSILRYGYYHAAQKKGFNANILFQEVKKGFMFADNHVVDAITRLEKNNLIIVAVSNKLGRFGEEKSFRNFCAERGHRFLSATGLGDVKTHHFDLFLEAMNVNYSRMKKQDRQLRRNGIRPRRLELLRKLERM